MSKKKAINFDISEIADGGVQVKLNRALQQVADNILDPNTDPTKKRKVQLNITLAPNEKRDASDVTVEVSLIKQKLHICDLTNIDVIQVAFISLLSYSLSDNSAQLIICLWLT